MTRQSHRDWREAVEAVQAELRSSPDDVEIANRLWALLSGSTGFDVRSGRRVIDTFGLAAFKSDEGLAALVTAFRQLADDTGELPRAALLDPPLESLLRLHVREPDHPLHEEISWLFSCAESDA